MESAQVRSRVDAEFVSEVGAQGLVELQGLVLPTELVQPAHQRPDQMLPGGVQRHCRHTLVDRLLGLTQLDQRHDEVLDGVPVRLRRLREDRGEPRLVAEVSVGLSSPHAERFPHRVGGSCGVVQPPRPRERGGEDARVDGVGADGESVARRRALQQLSRAGPRRIQQRAQTGELGAQHGTGILRRALAPEPVDQRIGRDRLPSGGDQSCEEQTQLALRHLDRDAAVRRETHGAQHLDQHVILLGSGPPEGCCLNRAPRGRVCTSPSRIPARSDRHRPAAPSMSSHRISAFPA